MTTINIALNEMRSLYGNKRYEKSVLSEAHSILGKRFKESKAYTNPDEVGQFLMLNFGEADKEFFKVMFLNNQHQLIKLETLAMGTVDQAEVYPREVARESLLCNATSVILAHNHPSGSMKTSNSDKSITKRIVAALELIHVRVLDHFIVARTEYYSMATFGDM